MQRVLRAAAVTPLPQAPDIVLGVLDLQGQVIPVINLRRRFRLPEREISSQDQFVVASSGALTLALVVDGTESVMEQGEQSVVAPEDIVTGLAFLEGVASSDRGLILIHDLETLLFAAEEELIVRALEQVQR